jgi:hypothetical protein
MCLAAQNKNREVELRAAVLSYKFGRIGIQVVMVSEGRWVVDVRA